HVLAPRDSQREERPGNPLDTPAELGPGPPQPERREDQGIAVRMGRGRLLEDTADRQAGYPGKRSRVGDGHRSSPSVRFSAGTCLAVELVLISSSQMRLHPARRPLLQEGADAFLGLFRDTNR